MLEATENEKQEHQLFLAGKNGKLTARHLRLASSAVHHLLKVLRDDLPRVSIALQDHYKVRTWTLHSCVQPEGDFVINQFSSRDPKVLGEVGAGQGKTASKSKDAAKEANGFNFGGSTGNKFGTAFSTQPIQVIEETSEKNIFNDIGSQPDSGGFGGFQTTARERVPSPPIPTVQARCRTLI